MGEKAKVPPPRRPLLTARQVAMIAAFGGLGFTWRALGLVIPLFPPFVLDIRETILVIAAFAGGPYVAIGTGILIGLPSAVPMCDVFYYPLLGIGIDLVAKFVYKNRKQWWAWVIMFIVIAVVEAAVLALFIAELAFVLRLVSFWPELVAAFGITYWAYVLQEFIPLFILVQIAPEFMKPTWSWRGGEIIEEE